MAIDLNSVRKAKNAKSSSAATNGIASSAQAQKEHIARPWETFDGLGPKVRTVQAHEAIRKITARRSPALQSESILSFKLHKEQKEALGPNDIFSYVRPPLQGSGLRGFIRRLFS